MGQRERERRTAADSQFGSRVQMLFEERCVFTQDEADFLGIEPVDSDFIHRREFLHEIFL